MLNSVHFIGILGSGMSALAQFCAWNGSAVSGSDRLSDKKCCSAVKNGLQSCGCNIFLQDGSGITENTSIAVVSTAIEKTNPDIARAEELKIPVIHRTDLLAYFVKTYKTIAVAGTSGKSTVTAMIFDILSGCGLSPSLITGANLQSLKKTGFTGNAYKGNSDLLVIEADESDGSLVKYSPYLSLFLNISKDHKTVSETVSLFNKLASNSNLSYINGDVSQLNSVKHTGTFGLDTECDFSPDKLFLRKNSSGMRIKDVNFKVPFPGRHSAENLLASVCACSLMGCSLEKIADSASDFKGVERRFNIIHSKGKATVIDDYAHNPSKIMAAVSTVQKLCERAFIIFQPHGFTPTKFMFNELVDLFNSIVRKNDTLILLPIYYAGGSVDRDISSKSIADRLNTCRGNVLAPKTREEILGFLTIKSMPGDIILSMGARDPSLPDFAQSIAKSLDSKVNT